MALARQNPEKYKISLFKCGLKPRSTKELIQVKMLEILDIGVERAIAYRLAGKVTEKDMKLAFGIIKEKIEQYGEVYIYQEIDDFIGMEFDAMTEKFKYLFENGVSNITRIAVVTE